MAGSGGTDKLPPNKCNRVQQEQIWKDYVHHEENAVKIWRKTWGFLSNEYKKMTDDIKEKQLAIQEEEEQYSEDEEEDEGEEDGSEEEDENEEQKLEEQNNKTSFKLPPIHSNTQKVSKIPFIPPPATFPPIKTSQEIGWRSARPECRLERFGNWGRPKKSILKHFNWSIYACP